MTIGGSNDTNGIIGSFGDGILSTLSGANKTDLILGVNGNDTLNDDNLPSPFKDFLYDEAGEIPSPAARATMSLRGGSGAGTFDLGGVEETTISEDAGLIEAGDGDDEAFEDDGLVDTINCGNGTDAVVVDRFDKTSS